MATRYLWASWPQSLKQQESLWRLTFTEAVPEAFELPTSDWTENSYCPIITKKFKCF